MAYAIKDPKGHIAITTIKFSKHDCIKNFMGSNTTITWRECRKIGWRCVKVEVKELSISK